MRPEGTSLEAFLSSPALPASFKDPVVPGPPRLSVRGAGAALSSFGVSCRDMCACCRGSMCVGPPRSAHSSETSGAGKKSSLADGALGTEGACRGEVGRGSWTSYRVLPSHSRTSANGSSMVGEAPSGKSMAGVVGRLSGLVLCMNAVEIAIPSSQSPGNSTPAVVLTSSAPSAASARGAHRPGAGGGLHEVTAPDGVTGSSDSAGKYHVHQTGALFAVRGRAGAFFITGGTHWCNHHHRSRCCHCHGRQCRRRCCRQRGCRGPRGWQRCGCCGQRGGGDDALERRSGGRGQRTRRGEAPPQGARGSRGKPCRRRSRHLAHGACARRGRRKRRGRLRRGRWRRKSRGRQRRRCGCGHHWRRCRGRGRLGCPSELRGRCGLNLACRR